MADGVKTYKITINGISESADAVKTLTTQLDELEKKINELNQKGINIKQQTSATKALREEDNLMKQIQKTQEKIIDSKREEYQQLLRAKDELREYANLAKSINSESNITAGINDLSTMQGMKQQLKDLKQAMQSINTESDKFKDYQKQANDLNNKLKNIEQGYGQYGRNVGNYANSMAEGFEKIKVAVGGTTKEYDNYRQAVKDLTNERFKLSQTVGTEAEEYKEVDKALKTLVSDYQDLNKSSAFMDNMLDTVQGFTALASVGVGISGLFGLDDADMQKTLQRFAQISMVLQGVETLRKQLQTNEGMMAKFINGISEGIRNLGENVSSYADKAGKSIGELTMKFSKFGKMMKPYQGDRVDFSHPLVGNWEVKGSALGLRGTEELQKLEAQATKTFNRIATVATKCANGIKIAFKAVAATITAGLSLIAMMALPEIMEWLTDTVKRFNATRAAAERAVEELKALNRQLEIRRDLLASSYLKGELTDEKYLEEVYKAQTESLYKQINALQTRAKLLQKNTEGWGAITHLFNADQNVEFTGNRMTGSTIVGHGRLTSFLGAQPNDITITVNSLKELEDEWGRCSEAINENKDYFDKWGSGVIGSINSVFTSVKDTEEVMRGLGNVRLSDFVARFGEVNKAFNEGKITADQFSKELTKLRNEMNNSEILNSVIANLDKYIPDEKVREAVQNIINEIYRLDDAFNMTSEGQIHYWNTVRIEGMKQGLNKRLEMIKENERHELATVAKTSEQQELIRKKYERQRIDAREQENKKNIKSTKKAGKELQDAENELIRLRIENMKDGEEKQLKLIEDERRLALQKAAKAGKNRGELEVEINKKYDRKILEEKRKWAFDYLKIYEDLAAQIEQVNRTTFEKEVSTAERNVSRKEAENIRAAGYSAITPSNYDNTKDLEAYYKKVLEIEKNALDKQTAIREEALAKDEDYSIKEENLRHSRLVDENGGDYIKQLRAGKITQEKYDELIENEKLAHEARLNAIKKENESERLQATEDNLRNTQEIYSRYFDNIINGVRSDMAKINEAASKPPVVDKHGWDVINAGATKENYRAALIQYENLKNGIIEKQKELEEALKANKISAEDFAIKKSELDDSLKDINQSVKEVQQSQKMLVADFVSSLMPYIQAVSQSYNQIMQAVWDAQDAAFDKEQEKLDKEMQQLEDRLNKQKELTEKYKDDVNDIEEELSDARGDRRQHLIDQLNAQVAAQRASWAEEKKIEKEKEAKQREIDDLDKKRKRAEYNRNIAQAVANGAMAVIMASVNKWPIPAIPMMALAASTTAAQIAIMKRSKPYGTGGIIQGKSHAQGGVPVLGGEATVEGGEFITNKRTTSQNSDLLYYINSKKKRVDLEDMLEFYNDKPRKSISSIKRKFADGGVLPTTIPEINVNDRLLTALEYYSSKPTYVSVVEIENKMEDVRHVRAIAGKE